MQIYIVRGSSGSCQEVYYEVNALAFIDERQARDTATYLEDMVKSVYHHWMRAHEALMETLRKKDEAALRQYHDEFNKTPWFKGSVEHERLKTAFEESVRKSYADGAKQAEALKATYEEAMFPLTLNFLDDDFSFDVDDTLELI